MIGSSAVLDICEIELLRSSESQQGICEILVNFNVLGGGPENRGSKQIANTLLSRSKQNGESVIFSGEIFSLHRDFFSSWRFFTSHRDLFGCVGSFVCGESPHTAKEVPLGRENLWREKISFKKNGEIRGQKIEFRGPSGLFYTATNLDEFRRI